ncbi:LamG-like jellyroll fold domain-containing protein [Cerasicoccus maritimus]|uniref:LamG-like jellyroll fold domain-containing protein n=1 Tax=Cerasicoccus maritimus TaxID=490089 RepID=UPI0028524EE1|nr:LamG-like jellyroll fold domain-containing protein [Cerasicoccus maritimus]
MKSHLFLLSLSCFFTSSLGLQAAIVYSENFDSLSLGSIDGQDGWSVINLNGTSAADVSNTEAQSGSQSLFMLDDDATNRPSAISDFGTDVNNGSFDFYVFPTSNNLWRIDFTNSGGGSFNFSILAQGGSGNIRIQRQDTSEAGSIAASSTSYATNTWNHFNIQVDDASGSGIVTLNGTEILNISDPTVTWSIGRGLFSLGYNGGTGISTYYDTLTLATVPEPGQYAMIVSLFSFAVVGIIRRKNTRK